MKINKELMKGSTSIMILSLLAKKDMYGYQMMQELKLTSNSAFELKEGTLYPLLHGLEKEGAVETYWFDTEEGRRRKYYKITDDGRETLEQKKHEWSFFVDAINAVIDGELSET